MDFSYSQQQLEIKRGIREWGKKHLTEEAIAAGYKNRGIAPEIAKAWVDDGWGMYGLPEEYGGKPVDHQTMAMIIEELNHCGGNIPMAPNLLIMFDMVEFGTPEQIQYAVDYYKENGYPPYCLAISEPEAGSANQYMTTTATKNEGANWILCPDESTVPEDFQHLHELVTGLDARVVSLRREEHDAAVAVVSHGPHMVASSLMQLASAHADDTGSIMRLAAGGFKDTTRIAAGSPKLWCGIAFDNACALKSGLDEMASILGSFAAALETGDRETFTRLLAEAADARRALPAAWVPSTEKLLEVRIPMVNRTGVVAEVCTIASSVGCNIQSIDIDHISEGNAVLSLILTDEGDIGQLSMQLINAGFSVSFSPLMPKEYAHVE